MIDYARVFVCNVNHLMCSTHRGRPSDIIHSTESLIKFHVAAQKTLYKEVSLLFILGTKTLWKIHQWVTDMTLHRQGKFEEYF